MKWSYAYIPLSVRRPHIVFRYGIKLSGQLLQLNITTLRLTGCEVKLLGHNLFSYCGFLGRGDRETKKSALKINLLYNRIF